MIIALKSGTLVSNVKNYKKKTRKDYTTNIDFKTLQIG